MNLTSTELAVLIVIVLVGRKLIDQATGYFFGKLVREDYVTKHECETHQLRTKDFVTKQSCEQCSKADAGIQAKLISDVGTCKDILLILAVKQGVPPEQLTGLTH